MDNWLVRLTIPGFIVHIVVKTFPTISITESAHNFRFRGVRGRCDGDLAGFLPGELGHAHLGVGQSQGPGLAAAMLVLLGHLGRLASRHRARYVATNRL